MAVNWGIFQMTHQQPDIVSVVPGLDMIYTVKVQKYSTCKFNGKTQHLNSTCNNWESATHHCSLVLLNFKGAALVVLPVPAPYG